MYFKQSGKYPLAGENYKSESHKILFVVCKMVLVRNLLELRTVRI